jgi:acid phosphatase type 7
MDRNARTPESTSRTGTRVRSHSLVVTLLFLTVTFTLVAQLASKANVPPAPGASGPVAGGSFSTSRSPSPSPTASPRPTPVPDRRPQVVYAAGDIADCPDTVPAVADLVRNPRSLILAIGDIVYPSGGAHGFTRCFDPVWGALKSRIRPVPGNHDYLTPGARGYYSYFGALAGDPSQGYYSFDLGWWHIIAINSICQPIGGCREGTPEIEWLKADLASHPAACTLAYWHHPRFSSGDGASRQRTASLWAELYAAGADVILNGHDHDYERFAPMDPDGQLDPARGIREFIVGTGGANLTRRLRVARHSEIWTRDYHGLLELTLRRDSYDWRFIAAETDQVIDSGTDTCH